MYVDMISVIVPVYNVEKYLKICIESILNQTNEKFELILIDDGSTDGSPQICDEYAAKDKRIKVIHQINKGLSSARNAGIRKATGKYFYFVDSDDCIHPQLLEIVREVAESKNANIVQVGYESVPSDYVGPNLEDIIDFKEIESNIKSISEIECIYNLEKSKPGKEYRLNIATTVVWTKLYRKDAFDSLLFPEGMRLHEDQMVAHRNFIKGKGMIYIDIPLYYYRKAEVSLIREGWTPKRLAIIDCYFDRIKYVKNLNDLDLLKFVYQRFLITIIRNYNLCDLKLNGEDKRTNKVQLLTYYHQVYKESKNMFSMLNKTKFWLFSILPGVFIKGLRFHDKCKE